jgi:hypothetical protein
MILPRIPFKIFGLKIIQEIWNTTFIIGNSIPYPMLELNSSGKTIYVPPKSLEWTLWWVFSIIEQLLNCVIIGLFIWTVNHCIDTHVQGNFKQTNVYFSHALFHLVFLCFLSHAPPPRFLPPTYGAVHLVPWCLRCHEM